MKTLLIVLYLLSLKNFTYAQNLVIYKHVGINNKEIKTIIIGDSQTLMQFDYSKYVDTLFSKRIIKLGKNEFLNFLLMAKNNELKDTCCNEYGIGIFKVYFLIKGKEQTFFLPSCKIASNYFKNLAKLLDDKENNPDLETTFKALHKLLEQYVSHEKSK